MAYTTINKSTDYFNTKLWTTDGTGNKALTTGHSTDMVWIKFRDYAYDHRIYDDVRGVTKKIIPNKTDAESTTTDLASFDTNGFTVGSNLNSSGEGGLVGWSWKANGAGSSNTDGSITSTVSANTTSGFSIIQYTGNSTSGATIGHGLGAVPKVYFCKKVNSSGDSWRMYTEMTGNQSQLALDQTSSADSGNTAMWNSTTPTSSVITLGNHTGVNGNTDTFIGYAFAPVKGFSAMNSYVGNGSSSNPPFIYTGFKVGWVMIKNISATDSWFVHDHLRDGFNEDNEYLRPNENSAEGSGVNRCNLYSNGFTVPTTDKSHNTNGSTYIYMAFAGSPFTTSTGVPTTAR